MKTSRFSLIQKSSVVAAGLMLLVGPMAAQAMRAPHYAEPTRTTPPTAFLRHKVYSTDRLIAQLKADPGARKGYAKIFHISADHVVSFVERHCTTTTLAHPGRFTVYRVTTEGTIYPTLQQVPGGVSVFQVESASGDMPRYISAMGDPMKPFATAVNVRVIRQPAATKVVTQVSPSEETLVPTEPVRAIVPISTMVYAAPTGQASSAGSQPSITQGGEGTK